MIANPESLYKNLNVTNGTASQVRTGGGVLSSYYLANTGSSACFVKFYDKVGATASDPPIAVLYLPPSGAANMSRLGWAFSTGLGIRAVTGVADNDNTAPTANSVVVSLGVS